MRFGEIHVGTTMLEDCDIICANLFHEVMSIENGFNQKF